MPSGHGDAGPCRDVLEAPVAQVPVDGVRALVAREVHVGKAVAVHVAQGHAAALREMAVQERAVERDGVDEADPGPRRRELGEAAAAAKDARRRTGLPMLTWVESAKGRSPNSAVSTPAAAPDCTACPAVYSGKGGVEISVCQRGSITRRT